MKRIDKISVIGIVLSLLAILGGQWLEGGKLHSLFQLTAFLIVLGGTSGAVMLQSSLPSFIQGLKMAKWVIVPPVFEPNLMIQNIVTWSNATRRGGLLALESVLQYQKDPFNKKAIQLLIDGSEPENLKETMMLDIDSQENQFRQAIKIWESAGGYSPTIGILGAVLGLIHVMENLADPSKLGAGIAVAFVATVYGVAFANLLFLPIAHKLKMLVEEQLLLKEILIEGLVGITHGENPRIIETKLKGFLAHT